MKAWKILGCRLTWVLLFAATHSMSEFFRLSLCHCLSDVHRNGIFNLNLLLSMVKLRGLICSFLQIHLGWLTSAHSIHKLTMSNYVPINPLTAEWALRALIDFTLSNARRFYSSMGNPLDRKGLSVSFLKCAPFKLALTCLKGELKYKTSFMFKINCRGTWRKALSDFW